MLYDPHAIHIYTDGSCFQNPGGLSGCAAIVIYPDDIKPQEQIVEIGVAESNIIRMELLAVNSALQWLSDGPELPREVTRAQIISDSKFVIDCIGRAASWRSLGWHNFDGRPIEHEDLWKRFLSLRTRRMPVAITFHWTKGKKSPHLRQVDSAARSAAKSGQEGVDYGFRGGRVGRARGSLKGSATLYPARGQIAIICPYRAGLVGKRGENRIRFVVFQEERQEYVEKYYAYASPEVGLGLHIGHAYRVRFGNNAKYPVIEENLEEFALPEKAHCQSCS